MCHVFFASGLLPCFYSEKTSAHSDPQLRNNLLGHVPVQSMELELKAIIQQYLNRVVQDDLLPTSTTP